MPDYNITAHIEFPTRTGANKSAPIRMSIPADSELEAKAKAERFIQAKLSVVVDSCALPQSDNKVEWPEWMKQFGDMLGKQS